MEVRVGICTTRVQRSSLLRLMILVKDSSNHETFQSGAIDRLAGAINVTRHGGRGSAGVEFCRAEGLGFPQN